MELMEAIKSVESSKEFADWREDHPDGFLAHAFVMQDPAKDNVIQLGYYDEKKDRMSSFIVTPYSVNIKEDEEVLRTEGKILPLRLDQIKISIKKALELADSIKQQDYPKEQVLKQFFIIQELEEKCIYNITFITSSFKTLNVKLDASDGTTVKHSLDSLIHMSPGNSN